MRRNFTETPICGTTLVTHGARKVFINFTNCLKLVHQLQPPDVSMDFALTSFVIVLGVYSTNPLPRAYIVRFVNMIPTLFSRAVYTIHQQFRFPPKHMVQKSA